VEQATAAATVGAVAGVAAGAVAEATMVGAVVGAMVGAVAGVCGSCWTIPACLQCLTQHLWTLMWQAAAATERHGLHRPAWSVFMGGDHDRAVCTWTLR
jgi:hypothetical protein